MSRRVLTMGIAVAIALAAVGAAVLLRADWTFSPDSGKWAHSDSKDAGAQAADAQFERALEAFSAGDYQKAVRILDGYLRFYRNKRDCQSALFLMGESCRLRGEYDDAFTAYQSLLDQYSVSDLREVVLAREIELAQGFLDGKKRKILGVFWVSGADEGQTMLEKIFQRDIRGARGRQALLTLADYHFRTGHYGDAETEYKRLVANFPKDADVPQWKLLTAQAALAGFRGTRTDARPLQDAGQLFTQLQQDHPKLAKEQQVDRVLQGIAERKAEADFDTAEFYKKKNKDKGAIFYYRGIIRDYPTTIWAQRSRDRLTSMGVREQDDATAPPTVVVAGIGLPKPKSPDTAVASAKEKGTSPAPARPDNEDTPPVVVWAGLAAVLRDNGGEGVIDIGAPSGEPTFDMPEVVTARQLGDVADPPSMRATTRPEVEQ